MQADQFGEEVCDMDYKQYLSDLIEALRHEMGERLLYVGLQGSYRRGEATASSDIDIVVIIDGLTTADLKAYRGIIETLPEPDKSCGFICGKDEMRHWNAGEICQMLHETQDYFGVLKDLMPEYSDYDIEQYIKICCGNLFHEICHRYVHSTFEKNYSNLGQSYRNVFFILQNDYFLKYGVWISSQSELLSRLEGNDKAVLEQAMRIKTADQYDFETAYELLFDWCKGILNASY